MKPVQNPPAEGRHHVSRQPLSGNPGPDAGFRYSHRGAISAQSPGNNHRFAPHPSYRAYQLTKRLIIIFFFDEDGLSCGEHAYSDGLITAKDFTPVEDQYLPDLFKA